MSGEFFHISPNLIGWRGRLWSTCKARKPTTCCLTGLPIEKGDEIFRPIGNGCGRMERANASHLRSLAKLVGLKS